MLDLFNMILHIDQFLGDWVTQYGEWIYLVLFLIILGETGLVVLPFLPGDSLLFIAGAFGASGLLDPVMLSGILIVAAVRSEEHTSELQSLMRISYAVFCLKKK